MNESKVFGASPLQFNLNLPLPVQATRKLQDSQPITETPELMHSSINLAQTTTSNCYPQLQPYSPNKSLIVNILVDF